MGAKPIFTNYIDFCLIVLLCLLKSVNIVITFAIVTRLGVGTAIITIYLDRYFMLNSSDDLTFINVFLLLFNCVTMCLNYIRSGELYM